MKGRKQEKVRKEVRKKKGERKNKEREIRKKGLLE